MTQLLLFVEILIVEFEAVASNCPCLLLARRNCDVGLMATVSRFNLALFLEMRTSVCFLNSNLSFEDAKLSLAMMQLLPFIENTDC